MFSQVDTEFYLGALTHEDDEHNASCISIEDYEVLQLFKEKLVNSLNLKEFYEV